MLLLVATIQSQALAVPVTVNMTATIDDVGQNYFGGGVVDYFHVGELAKLSFTYSPDDTVVAGDPNGGKYVVTEFSLQTAAYTATVTNRGAITVRNEVWGDAFSMNSGYWSLMESYGVPLSGVPLLNGYYLSDVGFSLYSSKNVFKSNSLFQSLNLADFDSGNFYFSFREPGTTHAMGTMQSWHITSLDSSANSVPEPETYIMLVAGLGLLAGVARLRK